jgi:molybdenum-dependent DNA-binding transcriptional regulator ModE
LKIGIAVNAPQTIDTAANPLLLDADLLKTFVAIVETGSFSKAAQRVFRTPSAVSMQVKKMEELLGATVFERDSRSVTLTGDGEVLLSYAKRILALNREMMARFVTPDMAGTVRFGAPDDYGIRLIPYILRRRLYLASGTSKISSSCTCSSIFALRLGLKQRAVHADHRAANDVGRRALDRRVDRRALIEGAHRRVARLDVGIVRAAPEDRLHIAMLAAEGLGVVHVVLDARESARNRS